MQPGRNHKWGVDTGKNSFHVIGFDACGAIVDARGRPPGFARLSLHPARQRRKDRYVMLSERLLKSTFVSLILTAIKSWARRDDEGAQTNSFATTKA
jgi:hypothetical protein